MVPSRALLIAPLLVALPLLAQGSEMPALEHGPPVGAQQPLASRSFGAAAGQELWVPPLGGSLDISGAYRAPPHRYGAGHRGIDLAARTGEPVIAPVAGTVSFSGTVVDRGVLSIRVDERTVYTLEPVRSPLSAGEAVSSGAVIGEVASGGHCLAECLHLGVRVDGEYVNPLRYFLRRPVLLPVGRVGID